MVYRKSQGRRSDVRNYQSQRRCGQQNYEERKEQKFNYWKQNSEAIDEKENNVNNEEKLSNVSTANSDKRNQTQEEDAQNSQNKKIDYELHLISEQGEAFIKIENVILSLFLKKYLKFGNSDRLLLLMSNLTSASKTSAASTAAETL